jgi:hypothetical protein
MNVQGLEDAFLCDLLRDLFIGSFGKQLIGWRVNLSIYRKSARRVTRRSISSSSTFSSRPKSRVGVKPDKTGLRI